MATVQATSTAVSAQARTGRAATVTAWPPPSSGMMHTRPWRSSPLAGPVFSTLPPVIPESSEESHEDELPEGAQGHLHTRPPSSSSIVSQTGSLSVSASGYGSRNASGSASALFLVEGEASTSSDTLAVSTAPHGTSSSHASSQTPSQRPPRWMKSRGRRTASSALDDLAPPKAVSDVSSVTPPPRARTVSHGHARPTSFPVQPLVPSPTIPPTYSRTSPRPRTAPESDANIAKQSPSVSRDPTSNWMSSSPFGPAQTPKFSRLAMASPAVVMPLSAKEYRKQKARESVGKGQDKDLPTSSNRVTFIDNALSAFQSPNGVPTVTVSPAPSEDAHRPRSPPLSGHHGADSRDQPQPQVDHPPSRPPPPGPASMPSHPSSPKHKRPRSRPNTPPRSSPLAAHLPISPKSSSGTFYSLASTSNDDAPRPRGTDVAPPSMSSPTDDPHAAHTVPPARPRPRPRRRKSYPDRLSNGARLSLLEAMNRLSQESTSLHRLSGAAQTADGPNRLSVASQASGHTLFYDVGESEVQGQVTTAKANGQANGNIHGHADDAPRTTPVLHTQSLEDLSSTLTRTGIVVIRPDGDERLGGPLDDEDERKGKRNVRVVRISDIVEVSQPPMPRRRKLTKSRPGPRPVSGVGAGAVSGPGTGTAKEVNMQIQTQTQSQERRTSLLPWKSRGSGDGKISVVGAGSAAVVAAGEKSSLMQIKGPVHPNETTIARLPVPPSPAPIANGSTHPESQLKLKSNSQLKKASSDAPTPTPTTAPNPESAPPATPQQTRRYTFSFLPSSAFHRPKRDKSNTVPPGVDLAFDQNTKGKGKPQGIESGTNSTSTSIRTVTQGSQSTLVPPSPGLYDLTTVASAGGLSGSTRDAHSSVPMLRRLNAQEIAMQGERERKGDSTPSLITNGSTATSSSPITPSVGRLSGEPFVSRSSGLKESFTDTSEEDREATLGGAKTSKVCVHQKQEQSPLTRGGAGWGETCDEDEQYLRPGQTLHPGSRPGTASSTATETSMSYASFSTVPASTTSSSSTSRSESPVGDEKQDRVVSVVQVRDADEDEDVHTCALCGHQSSPVRSRAPSPNAAAMHPMFTVPLVTVPAPPVSGFSPVSSTKTSGRRDGARHGGGRRASKNERHASVPMPAATNVSSTVPPMRHVHTNGGPVTMSTSTLTMAMHDKKTATTATMANTVITSTLSPPPLKTKQRRRPQTAPAGTGDSALKFIDSAKVVRAREGSVDGHIRVDRATKHKTGGRESKFKAILKGLLRWSG